MVIACTKLCRTPRVGKTKVNKLPCVCSMVLNFAGATVISIFRTEPYVFIGKGSSKSIGKCFSPMQGPCIFRMGSCCNDGRSRQSHLKTTFKLMDKVDAVRD